MRGSSWEEESEPSGMDIGGPYPESRGKEREKEHSQFKSNNKCKGKGTERVCRSRQRSKGKREKGQEQLCRGIG